MLQSCPEAGIGCFSHCMAFSPSYCAVCPRHCAAVPVLGMLTAHGAGSWQERQGELTAEIDGQKLHGSDRSDTGKSL